MMLRTGLLALMVLSAASPVPGAPAELRRARELATAAQTCLCTGRTAEALPLAKEALAIEERDLPVEDPDRTWGLALSGRALGLNGQGREALPLLLQAQTWFGKQRNHPGESYVANALGEVYFDMGDRAKALAAFLQARDISHACGDAHGEGEALNNVGVIHWVAGEMPQAREAYDQALAIRNRSADRYGAGETLDNLGTLHYTLGQLVEAADYHQRALALRREIGDQRGEATSLGNLGNVLLHSGQPLKAADAYTQALALKRATGDRLGESDMLNGLGAIQDGLGEKHKAMAFYEQALTLKQAMGDRSGTALVLGNMGIVLSFLGENEKALELLEKSMGIQREVGDKVQVGISLMNQGIIHRNLGHFARALDDSNQALAIFRSVHERIHQALTLNTLATLRLDLGENAQVESLLKQALQLEQAAGDRHGEAISCHNMGRLLTVQGAFQGAQGFYERALAIDRELKAPFEESWTLDDLGNLWLDQGNRAKAQECFEQALQLRTAVGDKRGAASTLASLGSLRMEAGEADRALDCYERAGLLAHEAGAQPLEAAALYRQAILNSVRGQASRAMPLYLRMVQLQDHLRSEAFPVLTEAEQLHFTRTFEQARFTFIAFAATVAPGDSAARLACFEAWLGQKGAVFESQGRIQTAVLESSDPKVREQAKALQEARMAYARLLQSRPAGLGPEEYERKLKDLRERKEALEVALARGSRAFALEVATRQVDAARLRELLPRNGAYLDYAKVRWYDFETHKPAPSRYVAFLFRPDRPDPLTLVDLGAAEDLDGQVARLVEAIQGTRPVAALTQGLYQRLIQPLLPALAGVHQLFISPDGNLNLVPFELLGPKGKGALVDRFSLCYVSSGKELVRFETPLSASDQMVLLANPDFDRGPEGQPCQAGALEPREPRSPVELQQVAFRALPGTEAEAEAIRGLFPAREIRSLLHGEASEAGLRALQSPRILHLATHGYALGSQETARNPDSPQLRVGLALAGANTSLKAGCDEGLLSVEKVLGLNLFGTDLVVLSACSTGVGKILDGEGVSGLSRAFFQVGARSLVASLWPVPDRETRELMTEFYRGLAQGRSKAQALAQAKTRLRRLRPHPRYWAGFVLMGRPD